MNTREPNTRESNLWDRFYKRFDQVTGPKIRALVLLANVGRAAAVKYESLTGKKIVVIDSSDATEIATLGHYAGILQNQIVGVLTKKYVVQIQENEISIVGAAADENDIMPVFSGFGIAPILIAAGIAAVTLLGGGFITLQIIEARAQNEALKITERLARMDKDMMTQPEEKQKLWSKWKEQTAKETAAAAKDIPGGTGLLSRFLGEKGTAIAIAGILAIAAAYLLIPRLNRN